jgi:hypothetical protein
MLSAGLAACGSGGPTEPEVRLEASSAPTASTVYVYGLDLESCVVIVPVIGLDPQTRLESPALAGASLVGGSTIVGNALWHVAYEALYGTRRCT